ncbi:hypothetical protein [Actinomycetospora flava]|uniref:OmpA-like domain-containing protein n=1 Tax=Actinomycetospora flava TaxID=3129232 RepID=A0ABU8M544_9PSEU
MHQTPRSWARRRAVKVLHIALGGALLATAACGSGDAQATASIAVVTASHDDELEPTFSPGDIGLLSAHAQSARGRDDAAPVHVVTADPATTETVDLTPRRPNGQVELGARRDALIADRIAQLARVVDAHVRAGGEPDLLGALGTATRTDASVILVLADGLAPGRGWDFRVSGWDVYPPDLGDRLRATGALPDARGRTIVLSGLGRTAGDQPLLGVREQQRLRELWLGVCAATGARCTVDDGVRPARPPLSPVPGPVVDVPRIATVPGPGGTTEITIPTSVLFGPDSCLFIDPAAATAAVADVAARLRSGGETVTVSGRTAPVGDDGISLARCRAQQIADLLLAAGVDPDLVLDVRADGSRADPPDAARDASGRLDPARLPALRRVVLTLTPREMP